ncbi:uncharacterized protein KIAA2013 homolog isoform X2 [Folsomia candida]|uniref:uncharacterized protein KIAA2013 homolog isoform X2 n=1 Tax=Folsomia candida TaxID=158441 RepID=UPI000B8FB3D0|nr:uncharacterized protein KIAA2013 homolog isoform X2 [Folsomia candida]
MDFAEGFRRLKRLLEVHSSIRRLFLLLVILVVLLWMAGYNHLPYLSRRHVFTPVEYCLDRKISKHFEHEVHDMSTNVMHIPKRYDGENSFLPYVGNGYIGLAISEDAAINVKDDRGRTLNVPIPFRPSVQISVMDEDERQEALVSQFTQGVAHRIMCIARAEEGLLEIWSSFYAHRTHPSVLEQNITVLNSHSRPVLVQFDQLGWNSEPHFKTEQKKLALPDGEIPYIMGAGIVTTERTQIMVAVAYKKVPNAVQVSPHETLSLRIVTIVNYAYIVNKKDVERVRAELMTRTDEQFRETLRQSSSTLFRAHQAAWKDLWNSGFYISPSRAEDALNGDKINATLYNVLSQVRDPLHEVGVSAGEVAEANAVLSYSEGCYTGHHTLQAPSLWTALSTEKEILRTCNVWIITLDKMGCHKLLRAGAPGVMQGMILSFGAFKFRNSHLEFNTEPKDLHRDYHFRRILYGNSTHLNVSVVVGEDNKAVLHVALDRKDKDYFACDAGCLDPPVELGIQKQQFPVKITDPITSILYITSDRRHAEELRVSIHVKEILEAPAHEHHVISMHRHGSGYSAMSTMFWVFLSLLIVLFHLFLFHLVYTEYFGSSPQDNRYRASRKVSDF